MAHNGKIRRLIPRQIHHVPTKEQLEADQKAWLEYLKRNHEEVLEAKLESKLAK